MEDLPDESSQERPVDEAEQIEDQIFVHCLKSLNTNNLERQHRTRPDYRSRLETEQANWETLRGEMTQAFLEYKTDGAVLSEEGELFECRVLSIEGTLRFAPLI